MIIFRNQGKIDIRSIKTFGVNAKESSSPIGFFGTGLKYAIAICLREGLDFKIYTGGAWLEFGVSNADIRNSTFKIVTMNNEELAFTTELGKNWELWQAFRELYCNALDEDGYAEESRHFGAIKDGETLVVVTGEKMEQVWKKRFNYIIDPDRVAEVQTPNVDFFERPSISDTGTIFYRGIRIAETDKTAMYDYNLKAPIDLTENRTPLLPHQLDRIIKTGVLTSKDRKFIYDFVMAPRDLTHEGSIDFSWNYGANLTGLECATFFDVVGEIRERFKDNEGNPSALRLHAKVRNKSVLPKESVKLNDVEQRQYDRAYKFCKEVLGLQLDNFKTVVVESLGNSRALGRADMDKNVMYISRQCFKDGTKRVAAAFLEEFTHLQERVFDETLEQKWVYINTILSLGERLAGEPL